MTPKRALLGFLVMATYSAAVVLGYCHFAGAHGRSVSVSVGVPGVGSCGSVGVGYGYGHVGVGYSAPAPVAAYAPVVQTYLYPYVPTVSTYIQPTVSVPVAAPPPAVCQCPQVPVGVPAQTYQPPVAAEPPVAAPPPVQTYSTQAAVGVGYAPPVGVGYGTVGVGYAPSVGVGYGTVGVGVVRGGYGYGTVGLGVPVVHGRRVFVGVGAAPVVRVDVKRQGILGRRVGVRVSGGAVAVGAPVRVDAGGRKGLLERLRERRARRADAGVPEPFFAGA